MLDIQIKDVLREKLAKGLYESGQTEATHDMPEFKLKLQIKEVSSSEQSKNSNSFVYSYKEKYYKFEEQV